MPTLEDMVFSGPSSARGLPVVYPLTNYEYRTTDVYNDRKEGRVLGALGLALAGGLASGFAPTIVKGVKNFLEK